MLIFMPILVYLGSLKIVVDTRNFWGAAFFFALFSTFFVIVAHGMIEIWFLFMMPVKFILCLGLFWFLSTKYDEPRQIYLVGSIIYFIPWVLSLFFTSMTTSLF